MFHPSMGPEEEPEMKLPEGVTPDRVQEVVEATIAGFEKIGMYADPFVAVHSDGELVGFMAQFDVGKVAFTPRVQDPEQEKFDDTFRTFQTDAITDRADQIRRKFRKKDEGDGS